MDLLKGPVFNDDRQVHYLEASIWRSYDKDSDSSIYIQARRLIDLFKIWDLYQEIDEPLYSFDEEVIFPFPHLIKQDLWDIAEAQYKIIGNSKVSQYDRPGLKKYIGPTMMDRFCRIDPFTFDLGHLPSKGESKKFQNDIINIVDGFCSKYPLFGKIYFPIELDIQVTKTSFKHFTDLDNVATKICKEFRKVILYKKVYINGYRIYVVNNLECGIKAGVRLKLLPAGEIESYNDRMEKALAQLEEKLNDDLWV